MKSEMPVDPKLRNAVLYLLRHCGSAPPGSTALIKMLWFADSLHYKANLSVITGAEYVAMRNGPVIDNYKEIFSSLEADGSVQVREIPTRLRAKKEYIALAEPDETIFSISELQILAFVADQCAGRTGTNLSDLTHDNEGPWRMIYESSEPNRRIPRGAFRWLDNEPDISDLPNAHQQLRRPEVRAQLALL